MKWFWSRALAGKPARPAGPARPARLTRPARPVRGRRRRRAWSSLAVVLALAGMGLAPVSAAAAPDPPPSIPPPAPGVAPGLAVRPGPAVDMLYTATDGVVWIEQGGAPGGPPVPYGGRIVSAPAPIIASGTDVVFGQGTDNQLWYNVLGDYFSQPWHPLGGRLTSSPGAVSLGGGAYAVFVRGADGAVWERMYSGTAWSSWRSLGGHVLAGTGPTAAYLTGSHQIYVAVVGTNRQLYLKIAGLAAGFFSIGGQTTASPALTAISPSTLVAFSRGTNGAGYYDRYTQAGGQTGWRSIGGQLTSGLAAGSSVVAGKATTYTMALGTDNQIWETVGNWASSPPSFGSWTQQTSTYTP
jgi:hypothetical protein